MQTVVVECGQIQRQNPPVLEVEPVGPFQTKTAEPGPNSSPPVAAAATSFSIPIADVAITIQDDPLQTVDAAHLPGTAVQSIVDDRPTPITTAADPLPAAGPEQAMTPAIEQPTAAMFSGPLTPLNFVTSAMAGLFGNPLLAPGPVAPAEPPMLWAMLAFARKQSGPTRAPSRSSAWPTHRCAGYRPT